MSQRAASTASSAGEASATRLNVAAAASTTLAVGSIAWYYHLYGPVAHAMTPAEEGYVSLHRRRSWDPHAGNFPHAA